MVDEENKVPSQDAKICQDQDPQQLQRQESVPDYDVFKIQELLQDQRLLEYVMEDKEMPEKRRKLEGDKRDGVLAAPSRSPRVVLNKIKLKEDVLERLRKIKNIAQAQVKGNLLSTVEGPGKEVEETKAEQLQDKNAIVENKTIKDGTWNERNQKRKREDDDEDGQRKKQNLSVTKVAKVNSESTAKETRGTCGSDGKEDADRIVSQEQNVIKPSEEDNDKKEDRLPINDGYTVPNSEEQSVAIATPIQGDEVSKAAQNYAKSGAQTEPQQDKLLTDIKRVVVVTEVLEEGDIRLRGESVATEHEIHVDNHGEKEETLSDEVEGEEDPTLNAIYQLIKDVVKNRTDYFESALLRENEKLEERVQKLEKQNALLQRVGCRLDNALKEITRKKQEAILSRISRGTQVNMNLHLSRTSTSKSTPIEIDIPEEANDKTSSPQPNSNSAVDGTNLVRSSTNKTTIFSKTTKEKASSSPTPSKTDTNRPTKTQPGKRKSFSEVMSAAQSVETAKKVSRAQQFEQQDSSSNKKLRQGMGHFRLSPSYKRVAQQQMVTDDTIETGHFLITPAGLEQQSIFSCHRRGSGSANEPSHAQVPTRPSSLLKAQKMDTSVSLSSSYQSNSNSSTSTVSSSTSTRGESRSSLLSEAAKQEERSHSVPYSSVARNNATGNGLEKRSQSSSTLTVPTPSSQLSKPMTQEKRNLSAPPSLINTKTTRVVEPERKSQTPGTFTVVTGSRASALTKQPLRTSSTESMDTSRRRNESTVDEEPDIVIVSPTTILSPKEQPQVSRNERVGSQVEVSGPPVQNNKEEQPQVRIHRVDNHSARQERPPPSDRQRTEITRTQQHVQQHPQAVNQPSSNQQIVYRKHGIERVSKASRENVSNEPQRHVRYVMREDGTCLQVVHEQPRHADKGEQDPRQPAMYGVQEARAQPPVIREQALHQAGKGPTAVRYDPKQPPRYIIQEGPPHRMHEGPRQPLQGGPQQQALPPSAILVHQQHQGNVVSTAGDKAVGPRPPPIGIQDVRTQSQQPFATQQAQQHITVKQHLPVQNSQHPHQYQHATYQYQQPPPRPTIPQQQTVARTQNTVYYSPQAMQQVSPRTNNQPTGYQPRPTVLPQEYVASSRIPPERATVKSSLPVGHVNVRQPPPDVVYRPRTLEGSTIRPPAPMPNQGYQPRPTYAQQVRQQQINNQGMVRPMVEHSIPRPSNQGGARYVQQQQQQQQQNVQERRTLGEIPPEKTQQPSAVIGKDAALRPLSPPKPTASIAIVENGIVLSWNITTGESTENIECYELFACQDDSNSTLPPIMWKKIGVVKALPLPMACTLTQFSSGSRYQFAVRAVDTCERAGPFSDPCVITLKR